MIQHGCNRRAATSTTISFGLSDLSKGAKIAGILKQTSADGQRPDSGKRQRKKKSKKKFDKGGTRTHARFRTRILMLRMDP